MLIYYALESDLPMNFSWGGGNSTLCGVQILLGGGEGELAVMRAPALYILLCRLFLI